MNYVFEINNEEREALYSAMCAAGVFDRELLATLANPKSVRVEIREGQLGTILKALETVIERYESDHGDWLRAQEYRAAKGTLIAKTRMQFKVVDSENQ